MNTYAVFNDSFFHHKPWWMPKKLHQVVGYRSNPRSKEMMTKLLQEKFPQASIIDKEYPPKNSVIVLLYPDSIGLGWGKIEKEIKKKFKNITILNGRHRCFSLTPFKHRQLLVKRFLEITFLPELLFAPLLIVYGLLMALKDRFIGLR